MLLLGAANTRGDLAIAPGGYHAQVVNYFCAAASTEMALDVPAVTSANAEVAGLIAAGDGPFFPANTGFPLAPINVVNGTGTVGAGGAQAFIYGLNHGLNTVNGVGYFNPFVPAGVGTDSQGIDAALNLLDNPNWNGPVNPLGSHQYAGYNLTNQALATRTIANAISQFIVPAVAAVNHGGHAISVYGVKTIGAIVPNANFTVQGVYVHDPWTGWAVNQQNGGFFDPAKVNSNGGLGLGYNTYLRYGFDNDPANGPKTILPNGVEVAVTLAPWTRIFSPAGPQVTPNGVFGTWGYKFEVEPQGPELPDLGDPAGDFGFPSAPANLASPLTGGSTALAAGVNDLAGDATLQAGIELAGGVFDVTDARIYQTPDEAGAEGDWLVPYDGPGGINDVTGAMMIDAETGVIDMATWIDPADPLQVPYTLSQIQTLFEDLEAGDLPIDNPVPESCAYAPIALLAITLGVRRRVRSAN